MEIKTGGRQNGQKIHNAIKLLDYINNLPENKIYGIQKVSKDITILIKEECIPIQKLQDIFEQRLHKYQKADDGKYKQEYLTRGELELVDRYKECSELYKLLFQNDVYKLNLDFISKQKVKDKIKELEEEGYWDFYEEVDLKKTIKILKNFLEED